MKQNILVLCTGNSCRSQIAEGYLRHFGGDKANVYSAGIEAHGVNPRAIATMVEDGIDISGHTSDTIEKIQGQDFDFVITVCDNARERCPFFTSKAQRFHQNFPDPARATGSEEAVMQQFRTVRQQIRNFSKSFVETYLT